MWFHASAMLRLFPLLPILLQLPVQVRARFCEGGHICSLPRECCTQGCCPPYQGGPRQLPPPSEHVLNLFFISHWFFWCVVVAVILAILCAYSLWKKRRTLCGWGFTEHHTQSEGDSAGSCYAPPQYSRCNSFHHPPPPYTEVTSKPDLYPLVFTCNSDNSKGNAGGSSYLMVQYFRNYIVRPAGSLSAASTVDSLSSSFICNINEANTLVPPPYSRAASPELSLHYAGPAHHREQTCAVGAGAGAPVSQSQMVAPQYGLPRSASQLVEPDYQPRQMHYATVALGGNMGVGAGTAHYSTRLHASHSGHFSPDESGNESAGGGGGGGGRGGFLQSQSDQHFRYMGNNSSSSLSDIFVNNSCAAGFVGTVDATTAAAVAATQATSLCSLAMAGGSGGGGSGTSMMYGSGGCIQSNPLHSLENCCQLVASTAEVAAASASAGSAGAAGAGATASTVSGVSSLSNIGTPSSPPQATSPTGEVREILDQISQLQADVNYEQLLLNSSKPRLQHTLSTPMARPATLQHQQQQQSASASASASSAVCSTAIGKKYYASKPPNKALYIPMAVMTPPTAQRCVLKSPISSVVSGANFFVNRGRVARKGWITRSAPTTPGSGLPPNRLGDDSPLLLNEHDEDAIDGHGGQLE